MNPRVRTHEAVDRLKDIVSIDIWFKYGKHKRFLSMVDRRGDPIIKEYLHAYERIEKWASTLNQ